MLSGRFLCNSLITKICCLLCALLILTSCGVQHRAASSHKISGKENSMKTSTSQVQLSKKYATILQVSPREITNPGLYKFIDDWMNTPYQYGGCSKSGIDCSGFSSQLMKQVYSKDISGSSETIFRQVQPVTRNELTEGDLVFFKINSKQVNHIGVYLMNGKFIHASTKAGVIISDLKDPYYDRYFFRGGRVGMVRIKN